MRHEPPIRRRLLALGLLALLAVLPGCADTVEPEPPAVPEGPEGPDPPGGPPVYRVAPPEGKLPWPHHDPDWDQARYDEMIRDLWVINNYGLYQGGAHRNSLYLHDALDVVLPNGTPIFAVEMGVVRANIGGDEHYRTLLIEDLDRPGRGWGYTHVYHFTVQPGDTVHQGTRIGSVHFLGLEHIHLWRVHRREGGSWSATEDLVSVHPDSFFVYIDTEPPVFEGRFRYVRARTDSAFLAPGPDVPVTVSGDVNIVVGLRDAGEWTRSTSPVGGDPTYGDRHAPTRVEYDIAGSDGVIVSGVAFDLSQLRIPYLPFPIQRADLTLSLYQHYESVNPPAPPPGNNNQRFSYFILTNSDGRDETRELRVAERQRAWRTAETGPDGARRFPDGEYTVTVRAYDSKGNMASRTEPVLVSNP